MSFDFRLAITATAATLTAEFDLRDGNGAQLAYRSTDFHAFPASEREKLFDLHDYLRRHVISAEDQEAEVRKLGVFIAERVLGPEVFGKLSAAATPRLLQLSLTGAAADDALAAGLARVPWEMARAAPNQPTLAERNLHIVVADSAPSPANDPLALAKDEDVRILFVFGAARASRPLAARLERRRLRELFQTSIFPDRRVQLDILSQGVTRARLTEQVKNVGGYHIVHWSGHGQKNCLELAEEDDSTDLLSGEEFLGLFADAGVAIPRLVFLSACHSGTVVDVRDWQAFIRAARDSDPFAKDSPPPAAKADALAEKPGFAGTAKALRAGGVKSVVAMRYSVGDDYARELALKFYDALLAREKPLDAAAALTAARKALLKAEQEGEARFQPCDHATPVCFGEADPGVAPVAGRSDANEIEARRLPAIAELDAETHQNFVGRTWVLAELERAFFGVKPDKSPNKLAVLVGLGGMGKTALAAEAIDLWQDRFDWILLFQAKPNPLRVEEFLRTVDLQLRDASQGYRERIAKHPREAIFIEPDKEFSGERRFGLLADNLARMLAREKVLIILDNFETNLKPRAEPGLGEAVFACQDELWDRLLSALADTLRHTRSRVLLTSRLPPAAAARHGHVQGLGPLTPGEAALFVAGHAQLRGMIDARGEEAELAQRVIKASRFHPLLLDRLGRLAAPGHRPNLLKALAALKDKPDFSALPDVFAMARGGDRAMEAAYLKGALSDSIDLLLDNAGADARRLLWIVALANDPVALGLLAFVWSGEELKTWQLRQLKTKPDLLAQLPPEIQQQMRAQIDALPPPPPQPDPGPLLERLAGLGLVDLEKAGADGANPDVSCHELVCERIFAAMALKPDDLGGLDAKAVRGRYGDFLAAFFQGMQHQNMEAALEAGARAIIYLVQAQAFNRLAAFATAVVTGMSDPRLLLRLLPHLQSAAHAAPDGRTKWRCLSSLADALRKSGCPDLSLAVYDQAAGLAKQAAEAQQPGDLEAWADVAVITGNWAIALVQVGRLPAARHRWLESADANRKAGRPLVNVLVYEMEALRIDVMMGNAEQALPEIARRLDQLREFWARREKGESLAEAPDRETLARTLISALDIAREGQCAQQQWPSALAVLDETLALQQQLNRPESDIGRTRFNRASVLMRLGQLPEAKAESEACLDLFAGDPFAKSKVLSGLASLYDDMNDTRQSIALQRRALSIRETLPDPGERAISHHNLANYLLRSGDPAARLESSRHLLAGTVYFWATGSGENLKTSFAGYIALFRRARAENTELIIPRLAELLADPAFASLAQWLKERGDDLDALQQAIDQFLAQARQVAEQEPKEGRHE